MNREREFSSWFKHATGHTRYPCQIRFACEGQGEGLVPTGLGKTVMAVLGWLWRRRGSGAHRMLHEA